MIEIQLRTYGSPHPSLTVFVPSVCPGARGYKSRKGKKRAVFARCNGSSATRAQP